MERHYQIHYQFGGTHQFWFKSEGRRTIIKCVQFDKMGDIPNLYHLSLLDFDPSTNRLMDNVISDNGDTERVMETVVHCIQLFLLSDSKAKITFTGNSISRDRLFRRQINKSFHSWHSNLKIEMLVHQNGSIVFTVTQRID
jgi:hypothetical protein